MQARGRKDDALVLLREAIEMAEDLGPDGLSEVAYIRNIRGYIQYQRGRYREALDDMVAALAAQRGIYDGDSIDLVGSLNNVGGMMLELERYDEARAYIEETLALLGRIYEGEDHPSISRAKLHLARIALARGDTATAVAGFEESAALMRDQLGPDNPYTWSSASGLATARTCQGRMDEARAIYGDILGRWLESRGPDYFRTRLCRERYAAFLLRDGDAAAAREQLQLVIDS